MPRFAKWTLAILIAVALLEIPIGYEMGAGALHPARRSLTAALTSCADDAFLRLNAKRTDFSVVSLDGTQLNGWLVVPEDSSSTIQTPRDWVILFHGQGDNRVGMIGFAEFLLRAGYAVLMMDSRAQGASGGSIATYGAKESDDARTIVSKPQRDYAVAHIFALGVSIGAAIAIDSTSGDPRIEGVVAECPFASLQEASYEFVSGHHGSWLGRSILRPATAAGIYAMERVGEFDAQEYAPSCAVMKRSFPILLIVDGADQTLPPRHAEQIYHAASGPKQYWLIPDAAHASGLGTAAKEYQSRVLAFFSKISVNASRR